MTLRTKIKKAVIIMSVVSALLTFFGCGTSKNETVTFDGNSFTVLKVGKEVSYTTKKGEHEALFVFTAPETGVYTVWNSSEEYAFCRIYSSPSLEGSVYSDCQTHPFIRSFPLDADEIVYIGSLNFSSDKGYSGVITVD